MFVSFIHPSCIIYSPVLKVRLPVSRTGNTGRWLSRWVYVVKVTSSVLNPRCRRRERFLVLTSPHRVERLLSSWCGKTQIARIEAYRVATKSHRGRGELGRPAWYEILGAPKVDLLNMSAYCTIPPLLYNYDALILGSITRHILWQCMTLYLVWITLVMMNVVVQDLCLTFGAAHPSLRRAATCHVCLVPRVSVHDRYCCIYKCLTYLRMPTFPHVIYHVLGGGGRY